MDTSVEFQEVLRKQKTYSPITEREAAVAIANDPKSLLAFLADNDYAQVYRLLHEGPSPMVIGQNANFMPDKKRVEGELGLLLAKNDTKTLNSILESFVLNGRATNYTTNKKVVDSLVDIEALRADGNGYKFNSRLK